MPQVPLGGQRPSQGVAGESPVPGGGWPDLPAIEREMLARWRRAGTFAASLRRTEGGPRWTFYEGPPTANGMPGIHHVEARALKDMICRFKTMRGFHVPRKAGWDCHGLQVEVAVEKELGLAGKEDIEAYGIARFNQRCRESVLRHVDAFAALTERMGYWTDLPGAYRTMDPAYVESTWWALKTMHDAGLLVRDFRVSPYCPRCGTALSEHEMGQPEVYRRVTDPSVIVRLPVTRPGDAVISPGTSRHLLGADLLVWTTMPWTLVASTAVAVHPDARYVIARKSGAGDKVVVAESRYARVLGEGWHVLTSVRGGELAGSEYASPFGPEGLPGAHVVLTAGHVRARSGTGLVHLAPAFGADDLATVQAAGLPVVRPLRPDGRFADGVPLVAGLFFQDANQPLVADLRERGLLLHQAPYSHARPHCWRCGTVLLHYALPSWYIRTTRVKDALLAANAHTRWQPPGAGDGRYGQWLRAGGDWALSRDRYWGTPLPLWECPSGHVTCAGSLAELGAWCGRDLSGMDPHRPFVDEVTFGCPRCGAEARRVPEVIDAWFDSGAMPFAQHGAPLRNASDFERAYPAQFICEGIDQVRGWFYALMAVGTLVFGRPAYESVACVGHVVDDNGAAMSSRRGNVIEPMAVLNRHGADAVRWFFAASGSPWGRRRVDPGTLKEIARTVLGTYWNVASLLLRAAPGSPAGAGPRAAPGYADRPLLDRWMLGEAGRAARDVTAAMEAIDSAAAGRRLAALLDDLSNWYVRRSRRRLRSGPGSPGGAAATATLHEALMIVTRLMAPVTPFLTDYVWGLLRPGGEPESVHLTSWPAVSGELAALADDTDLARCMALARRLARLGRSARRAAGLSTRRPLPRALVAATGLASLPPELRALVASELNVRVLEPLPAAGPALPYGVRPDFRALGARFGAGTRAVASAVLSADPAALARAVDGGRSHRLAVPSIESGAVDITARDVIVTRAPLPGWGVASAGGETVALDLAVTPALRSEGLAREVVRRVQRARRSAGLAVTDRIAVRWAAADSSLATALTEHGEMVAGEVAAASFEAGPPEGAADDWHEYSDARLGLRWWLAARR